MSILDSVLMEQISQITSHDPIAFRSNSQQLDEFLEGDYNSIAAELKAAFPSADNLPECYVPIVSRFAHELATLYRSPPFREFKASSDVAGKLGAIYDSSLIDDEMNQVQRRLAVQRTMIVGVFPRDVRRYRVMHWAPWECAVDPAEGADWKDIAQAREVHLRWPVRSDGGLVYYGRMVMTQSEIYLESEGKRLPVYGDSLANPFGRIPLVALRTNRPKKGRFFGPIAEDLLALEIGLAAGESDIENILRHQAWAQKVISPGPDGVPPQMMVDDLPTGPDRVMIVPSAGGTYSAVNPNPAVDKYADNQERKIKLAAIMYDISPTRFQKANTAQTGTARAADREDREQSRAVLEPIFQRAEREMLQIIGAISRLYRDPVPVPEDVDVRVRYSTWEPPADALRDSQADATTDQTGETSPVDRVAQRYNISRKLAANRIKGNLEALKALEEVRGTRAPMAGSEIPGAPPSEPSDPPA